MFSGSFVAAPLSASPLIRTVLARLKGWWVTDGELLHCALGLIWRAESRGCPELAAVAVYQTHSCMGWKHKVLGWEQGGGCPGCSVGVVAHGPPVEHPPAPKPAVPAAGVRGWRSCGCPPAATLREAPVPRGARRGAVPGLGLAGSAVTADTTPAAGFTASDGCREQPKNWKRCESGAAI